MREIEFRGKLIKDKSWTYGNLYIHKNSSVIITPYDTLIGKYGQVEPETVGQYTGLKDKNGTKIFEGDILEYEFEDIGKQKAYVDWNGKYASFTLEVISEDFEYAPIESGVIIGNIYDNPELIGEEV